MPSEHTILLLGLVAAAALVACALIARRDAWLPVARSHKRLLRGDVIGAIVIVLVALAIGHVDELEELVRRVERGNPRWLGLAVALEVVSFGGYVVLTDVMYRPVAARLDWTASLELTLAGVVATRVFSAGARAGSRSPPGSCTAPGWARAPRRAGWRRSWRSSTPSTWPRWCSEGSWW